MIMKGKYQNSSDIFASCYRPLCAGRTLTKRDRGQRRSLRSTASRTKHRERQAPPKIGGTEIGTPAFCTTRDE
jgi:hypothetical protein